MADETNRKRDLVLPPGSYAFMQDQTKGGVKVYTGPTVINQTAQEVPVIFNEHKGQFEPVQTLEQAQRQSVVLPEGFYANLLNPAKGRKQPNEGSAETSADLDVGRKIVVPGPRMFSLWPGQQAEVIRGHHLRSNQYLLARVYNEDEARQNWGSAVVKPATPPAGGEGEHPAAAPVATAAAPSDLTVGRLIIIRGTEVSFYIPPTGVTVVPEGKGADGKPNYVREALTLERLEYAILIDENGKKRYANGPTVVFPEPTERFMEAKDDKGNSSRKFRAIELNELQGIHLKVIADYKEGDTEYKAGEELFITGKDTAIYYPREEHSAIKYDGKTKHFATAIPKGEARYVLNRMTGDIKTVHGPAMLLPDPRTEVIVRRVLSDRQCELWYPGNAEALKYNQDLRQVLGQVPTTRGAPSEGDVSRNLRGKFGDMNRLSLQASSAVIADNSRVSGEQGFVGEEFSRASSYTQPRSVTLDTKFQGVPSIEIWTGYGVLVISKSGERKVVQGPNTVLLEYDESLEVLEMSTGKPKNTDNLIRTVFLRVENNQVTDLIRAETVDHVQVELKLSYRVNFEGDPNKWFAVENYVKYLCDHARSILKGQIKKLPIEGFYNNSTDLIRSMILGDGGKGLTFEANGMRVTDVEVLNVTIADQSIASLLNSTQADVVRTSIETASMKRGLALLTEKELITRQEIQTRADTALKKDEVEQELAASKLALVLLQIHNSVQEVQERQRLEEQSNLLKAANNDANLAREKKAKDQMLALEQLEQNQRIQLLKAEAETLVQRYQAIEGGLTEALLALSHNETLVKMTQAMNVQSFFGGNVAEVLGKMFAGSPVEKVLKQITANGATNVVEPRA